jgi:hypothetical protein
VYTGFDRETLRKGPTCKTRSVLGDMDWIDLAQDRDRWRAVVNAIVNLRVSENETDLTS